MNIKNKDGLFVKYFARSYSHRLVNYFAKKNISPNGVTLIGAVFMSLSILSLIYFFYKGNFIFLLIASIFSYVQFVLDCVDGDLARQTNNSSKTGQFLDTFFDYFFDVVYSAILLFIIVTQLEYSLLWVSFIIFINFLQFFVFLCSSNITKEHSIKGERPVETNIADIIDYIKTNNIKNSLKLLFSFLTEADIRRAILILLPLLFIIKNYSVYFLLFIYLISIHFLLLLFVLFFSFKKIRRIDKFN